MVKLIIAVACFAFAGLVVNNLTHGKLFGAFVPDPPDPPAATHTLTISPQASTVRVLIGGQVWTCRIAHGTSSDCTASPSARLRP